MAQDVTPPAQPASGGLYKHAKISARRMLNRRGNARVL